MSTAPTGPARLSCPVSSAQLRELLSKLDTVIDMQKLTDQTRFHDAGADSLDFFNIIAAIQDVAGITIPDKDLDQVGTIQSLAKYLNSRLS